MSTQVTIRTEGRVAKFYHCNIHPHPRINADVTYVHLYFGDDEISISFETADEMIEFCEKHNIPYTDERTKVDKYISRKRMEAGL